MSSEPNNEPSSPGPRGSGDGWNSRVGVILAVAGSAIGLGNFLRFPSQAAEHGGGAFIIAYLLALLLVGMPVAWVEWSIGRYGGRRGFNSLAGIFHSVSGNRFVGYLGVLGLLLPVMVYTYYIYVVGWCLGYAWFYLVGGMPTTEFETFFAAFVGRGADGAAYADPLSSPLIFVAIAFVLNFILIYRGVSKGIELFCKLAMPTLLIIALIILVRVLTLGTPDPGKPDQNVLNGLGYMWNPVHQAETLASGDQAIEGLVQALPAEAGQPVREGEKLQAFRIADAAAFEAALTEAEWEPREAGASRWKHADSRLTLEVGPDEATMHAPGFWGMLIKPGIWLAAAGQIFFSLSVGFGVIATYASYMKPDDDVALSGLTAATGNGFCELVLAGLTIVPAGFIFLGASFVANPPGTFGMGFVSLPAVFNEMPGGRLIGFLFFFLLFLAAMTSTVSLLQPGIAFLEEGLGLGRRAAVAFLGLFTALGVGFVMYFSAGYAALDTIDFWTANVGIVVLATIAVIVYGWVLGLNKGLGELRRGAEIPVPTVVGYVIKFVSPVFLVVILLANSAGDIVARLKQVFSDTAVGLSFGLFAVTLIFFLLLVIQAVNRWQREAERGAAEDTNPQKEAQR